MVDRNGYRRSGTGSIIIAALLNSTVKTLPAAACLAEE